MTRAAEIDSFLSGAGWSRAHRDPLHGDASARRYIRLRDTNRQAMLMDAPPGPGLDTVPFIAVARWLASEGFSAPRILAAAPERGLILLEDLGDDLFARLCARAPDLAPELYAAAIDLLAELHSRPPPRPAGGWVPAPYDLGALTGEALLVPRWYLPAASGPVSEGMQADYTGLLREALAALAPVTPVAVLRDYHAENLLWLPERGGTARVGLLDFQDMVIGNPAYDVISLLEDARRDTSPELRAAMTARYCAARGVDPESFAEAAHILAAQRNLKILGIFARLSRRDGKPRYLAHLPRVWAHLMRDLRHPALAALRRWIETNVPPPDETVRARLAGAAA